MPANSARHGGRSLRSMVVFLGIATTVFLAGTLFAAATFLHFSGKSGIVWLLVPVALSLVFVATTVASARFDHLLIRALYVVSAIFMAYLNYALVAALACWAIAAIGAFFPGKMDMPLVTGILYALAAAVALYGLFNASRIRIVPMRIALPGLPDSWKGRTVALVSDVHLGNVRGRRFVRKIVAALQRIEPDLVLVTGDMFDGANIDPVRATQPWAELSAPEGVWFVSGNHDEFRDRKPLLAALASAGVCPLDGEGVTRDGLRIVGVHDDESEDPQNYARVLSGAGIDAARPTILLVHQPRHFAVAEAAGVSLQLSGHTHGGQFWPWTHIVRRLYGLHAWGHAEHGRMQVVTTSGVGTWGPPIRVGTRSEIVKITLA